MKKMWKSYGIWGMATCIYIIVFFHRVSTGVVKDELFAAFDLTKSSEAGSLFALLGAMYMYAYMFMQIPTGILADTLGPRRTITLGGLVATVGALGFSLTQTFAVALLSRFIVGIGVSVVFICILKIIAEWFPKEQFGTMSGLTSFIGNMGALLAMTPLAFLSSKMGWRGAFMLISGITLVLAVLCWFFVKEQPKVTELEKMSQKQVWKALFKNLTLILKDKGLYPIMLAYGITFGSIMALTGTWGVSMVQDLFGVTKASGAQAMSIITLGVAFGSITIGKLSDYMKSHKKPMVLFASIQFACWLVLLLVPMSYTVYCLILFVLGFTGTSFIVSWAYAKERHPKQYAGVAMSVVNFAGFLGGALVPQLVGVVYDRMPKDNMTALWHNAVLLLTILSAVALLCLIAIRSNTKKEEY